MKKLFFLLVFVSGTVGAQEMINNGDFEAYAACPDGAHQIERADHWFTFGMTPEYYHECSEHENFLVPNNTAGYQEASTGSAYAGFIPIFGPGWTQREYLGNELVAPLTIGNTYTIEFKVSLGFNEDDITGLACSHLGAKFSTVPYSEFSAPAVDNAAHVFTETLITDTVNWVSISGTFVADSAYQYLIIGNFYSSGVFDTTNVGTNDFNRCYYYVEDVSVLGPSTTGIDEIDNEFTLNYDPMNAQATLNYNENFGQGIESINVYSTTGQLIYSDLNPLTTGTTIDCSNLTSGMYIVQVNTVGKVGKPLKFIVP